MLEIVCRTKFLFIFSFVERISYIFYRSTQYAALEMFYTNLFTFSTCCISSFALLLIKIYMDAKNGEAEELMTKPQRIAMEMLTTERAYVKKLHLLDQVRTYTIW